MGIGGDKVRRALLAVIAASALCLPGTEAPGQEYMFPDSSDRLLTDEDLKPLRCIQLWLARNEIYNRNGHCFSSEQGKIFFDNSDCNKTLLLSLSPREERNVNLIKKWERWHGCRAGAPVSQPGQPDRQSAQPEGDGQAEQQQARNTAETAAPLPPAGRWGGAVKEENVGESSYYTVIITFTGDSARILYPDQECGGRLTGYRRRGRVHRGQVHTFREKLDHGTERCQEGGLVELRFDDFDDFEDEKVLFSWEHPGHERLTVGGTLYNLTRSGTYSASGLKSCKDCSIWDFYGKAQCAEVFKRKWSRSPAALETCNENVAAEVAACRERFGCQ